jgi:ssDNA-binding Zn-finger/Zn-ribbon topoisomerase 1
MPSIFVTCPHCRQPAPIASEYLGQAVRCPRCGQAFHTRAPVKRSAAPRKARPAIARPKESWFVLKNDRQLGPFPMDMLKRMALAGHLTADMWLVMAGTDACIMAASIPGLDFRPRRTRPKARRAPTTAANLEATPAPRQQPRPAAPVARPAAPTATEIVAVDCPSCRSKCSIPRPQTPTNFNCPRCKQPFRAASTSIGVVSQRLPAAPSPPPANRGQVRPGRP